MNGNFEPPASSSSSSALRGRGLTKRIDTRTAEAWINALRVKYPSSDDWKQILDARDTDGQSLSQLWTRCNEYEELQPWIGRATSEFPGEYCWITLDDEFQDHWASSYVENYLIFLNFILYFISISFSFLNSPFYLWWIDISPWYFWTDLPSSYGIDLKLIS